MLTFPAEPQPGDTYLSYIWDGTKWGVQAGVGGVAGVSSFNTRVGAVVLALGDVTSATGSGSAAQASLGLATVAGTGAYADVSGTPAIPAASSSAPIINGAAAAGASALYSRGDHVHPTDTSRAPIASPTFTGIVTAPGITATSVLNSPVLNTNGIELGALASVGTPYIDFHSSGTSNDYDARLIANGGAASTGQATLTAVAATFSATGALQADHVFALRAGGGAVVGSWDSSGSNAFGMRNIGADGNFGVASPTTGALTGLSAAMYASGNFTIWGSVASKVGAGTWADSSDVRVKNELGPYVHGLAELLALRPVRYTFKDTFGGVGLMGPELPGTHDNAIAAGTEFIGLIAQEAEVVMPEMVTQTTGVIDGAQVDDLRVLDMTALPLALVNAVREIDARLKALEATRT